MATNSWLDLPQLTAGITAGLIAGIWADPLRKLLLRPKLVADFTCDNQHIRQTPANLVVAQGGQQHNLSGQAIYARVSIKNPTRFTANGCRAYLCSIHRQRSNGTYEELFIDTLQLPWAYIQFKPIDIPPGVSFFYDVCRTIVGGTVFNIVSESAPLILQSLLSPHGIYRIVTVVTGDNFSPIKTTLLLDWDGVSTHLNIWKE